MAGPDRNHSPGFLLQSERVHLRTEAVYKSVCVLGQFYFKFVSF